MWIYVEADTSAIRQMSYCT